jgi:hypothetical protein
MCDVTCVHTAEGRPYYYIWFLAVPTKGTCANRAFGGTYRRVFFQKMLVYIVFNIFILGWKIPARRHVITRNLLWRVRECFHHFGALWRRDAKERNLKLAMGLFIYIFDFLLYDGVFSLIIILGKYSNSPPGIAPKVSPVDWAYSKTVLCKKMHPDHLVHLRVRASKCLKMP